MTTIFIAIGFIAIFFVLMSVRLLFIKDGEFKGTCASQNPYLNKEGATCGFCGKTVNPGEQCANPEKEQNPMARFS
jgi:hypothetical protein